GLNARQSVQCDGSKSRPTSDSAAARARNRTVVLTEQFCRPANQLIGPQRHFGDVAERLIQNGIIRVVVTQGKRPERSGELACLENHRGLTCLDTVAAKRLYGIEIPLSLAAERIVIEIRPHAYLHRGVSEPVVPEPHCRIEHET